MENLKKTKKMLTRNELREIKGGKTPRCVNGVCPDPCAPGRTTGFVCTGGNCTLVECDS